MAHSCRKRSTSSISNAAPAPDNTYRFDFARGHTSAASYHRIVAPNAANFVAAAATDLYSTYASPDDDHLLPVNRPADMSVTLKDRQQHSRMTFTEKMDYYRDKGDISFQPGPQIAWTDSTRHTGMHFLRYMQRALRRRLALPRLARLLALALSVCIIAGALGRYAKSRMTNANKAAASKINRCEPYMADGQLLLDNIDPDGTYWNPYDKTCMPPTYFRALRRGNLNEVDFMRNRTVLLLGDAVDREHVELFCSLLGAESRAVPSHPSSSSTTKRSLEGALSSRAKDVILPRICQVPDLHFTLLSVTHHGLHEPDSKREGATTTKTLEEQLQVGIQPLLEQLRLSNPDLIEVASGPYDLMHWAREDISLSKGTKHALSSTRIDWYRNRVQTMMDIVSKQLPKTKGKLWRSMQYSVDSAAELAYNDNRVGVSQSDRGQPDHFAHARVAQIESVTKSLALSSYSGFRFNPFSSLLLGHPAHQLDRLHGTPGAPATVLWAEIMLYELHKAVTL